VHVVGLEAPARCCARGSFALGSAIAPSRIAASRTDRANGPAVSWLCEIGTIPRRLTSPTVGFKPTMPLIEAGLTMDPSVSEPTAATQSPAATATADPELEPDGVRLSA